MINTNEPIAAGAKAVTKRPRKMAREPKPEGAVQAVAAATSQRQSKADLVLGLLKRAEGATIEQLVAATGWLPHSTRAALTGFKKKGHSVGSEKLAGGSRIYRVIAA